MATLLVAASDVPAVPVLGLMVVGVLVAMYGHASRSPRVVAVGLALLFLATALMVVLGFLAFEGDDADPRPPENPETGNF